MNKTFKELVGAKEVAEKRLSDAVAYRMELEAHMKNGLLPLQRSACKVSIGTSWAMDNSFLHNSFLHNSMHKALLDAITENYPMLMARMIRILRNEYVSACEDCQDGALELLGEIAINKRGED